MKFAEYWKNLSVALDNFKKTNKVQAKGPADEKCYTVQLSFLNEMMRIGTKIAEGSLSTKLYWASTFYDLPTKTFGPKRVLEKIEGPLSLALSETVYLPHLNNFKEITLDDQNFIVKKAINIETEKKAILVSISILKEAISKYREATKSGPSPHLTYSLLAPSAAVVKPSGENYEKPQQKAAI